MKNIVFRVFAVSAGLLIALILPELFLRINPQWGYTYALPRFKADNRSEITQWPWLQPSASLGYEHIPAFGSCGGAFAGAINSLGLVGKEHPLKKEPGTYRVLVLGDSIAEQGWSCGFLEDQLNNNRKLFSPAYENFEVWNAGVTGYDVRRYYIFLKQKGIAYQPDSVVIFLCLNDFNLNANVYYRTGKGSRGYYFSTSEISRICAVSPFFMEHSYLYRFVMLKLNALLLARKIKQGSARTSEDDGRYYFGLIQDICREKRIPLCAVIFPYFKPLSDYSEGERYEYAGIRKVISELGIDSLDLHGFVPENELVSLRILETDFIHPGKKGHIVAGEAVYEYLTKNYFRSNTDARP